MHVGDMRCMPRVTKGSGLGSAPVGVVVLLAEELARRREVRAGALDLLEAEPYTLLTPPLHVGYWRGDHAPVTAAAKGGEVLR